MMLMSSDTAQVNDSGFRIFSIPLLAVVKAAQQAHGLRHGDYQRYHQYITRKLRRMRKSLHFQQGTRSKVTPKKLSADMITDPRFILLKVFEIERSWSYAMQLKAESNTELRKRFQLVSRLRKAVLRGEQLLELTSTIPLLDAQSNLELKAYVQWIHGVLSFELQDWVKAKEYFESTQTIYAGLVQTVEDDGRDVYTSRLDDIIPQIHYCAYNIGDESAASDLQRMRAQATPESMGGFAGLQLDQLLNQARAKQAGMVTEVEWFGITIPVKLEKAKMAILTVKDLDQELLRTDCLKSKLSLYDTILKSCVESVAAVREEIRIQTSADGTSASAAMAPISDKLPRLQLLYNYLQFLKLSKTIDRTLLHVADALSAFGLETSGQVKELLGTSSYAKPQELSRLYDTLVQNFQEILSLQGVIQESMGIRELLHAKMLAYRSYRCYYLAFTYVHRKRFAECSALLLRARSHAEEAIRSLSPSTAPWTTKEAEAAPGPTPDSLIGALSRLLTQIEAEDLTCRAAYMLDMSELGENSSSECATDATDKDGKLEQKPLLNRLHHFADVKSIEKTLATSSYPFVNLPPDFEPVPVKPVFFDLALNHINFPSLNEKLGLSSTRKDTQSSGITGLVRGWLWGGSGEDRSKANQP